MDSEESILSLPRERLDLIDHDVYKWVCCIEGCTNGTHVRDYGESPLYYHPRKSIGWFNADDWWWYCSKHYPMEKKAIYLEQKLKYKAVDNLVFVKSITVTNLKLHE